MQKKYLWTKLKARLEFIRSNAGENYHWLFLPGGPGLGSESLHELTQLLHLPGTVWHLDLPSDGSNITEENASFAFWREALIEACSLFHHVILVAHSTGGMYALSLPELENILTGLVLLDSAPDASWQKSFTKYTEEHLSPHFKKAQQLYAERPNNETLKNLTLAAAPYLFTAEGLSHGLTMLNRLPYNNNSCTWSAQHFDQTYKATWIPKSVSTLILSGDQDHITPMILFHLAKNFHRKNIIMHEVKNASHFPWLDNPEQVKFLFDTYCKILKTNIDI